MQIRMIKLLKSLKLKAQMPRRIDLRGTGPLSAGMSGTPGRQEGL